jgi:aldehyde dehydrogenase (NAD+)
MAQLEQFRMVIGGKAVEAISGRTFESQNPYTGEPWARVPDGGPEDIDAAVAAARAALDGEWGAMTGFARAALMHRLGDLVTENAERLARLEVNDSGKLYREMIGQLNGLGSWYHYFAGLADKIEGRQIPSPNPNYLVYTRREPVGVVAAITP